MPNTPLGLYYPDASTNAGLVPVLGAMQSSVDAYLTGRAVSYATRAAMLAAIPTPTTGMLANTRDWNIWWSWTGAQWRHIGNPTFPDIATRDAQIPQPLAGDVCSTGTGTTFTLWTHIGSSWQGPGGMIFNLPSIPHPVTQTQVPFVGFTAVPTVSWGNTAWRGSVDGSALRIAVGGVYRIEVAFNFARSGDSDSLSLSCTHRLAGDSWVRPEWLALPNPTARQIALLNTNVGILQGATMTFNPAVTTTSASSAIRIERIGN